MSIWKRPDRERSAASEDDRAGRSSHLPEKTIGVTQSQILSTSPVQPELPRVPPAAPRRRAAPPPAEMSVWGGNVLLSDEFAPDAGRKPRRRPWRLLGILVVVGGLTTAGGLVWRSWPRVPFLKVDWPGRSTTSSAASAQPIPVVDRAAAPARAVPAVTAPAAPVPTAPVPASPTIAPAATAEPARVVKKAHSTKSIAKSKSNKRRHLKASKSSKRAHAKPTHRTVAADE